MFYNSRTYEKKITIGTIFLANTDQKRGRIQLRNFRLIKKSFFIFESGYFYDLEKHVI